MAKTEWESRKADQRTAKNADQTEFLAVKFGSCPLDEGTRDDRTADAMDDFGALDTGNNAQWIVDDSKVDDAVGAIADEIERRAKLMGNAYPFTKEGNTLTYRQSHTLTYEFCLAIINAPNITANPYNKLPPAFERLCRDVAKCFLGDGAAALRTGWPIDDEPWRTSHFRSVVDKMHAETKEWVWQPAPGMPPDPSHQDAKDLGIDFAVWKLFPDGRKGILFLLGQCACGDDWTDKFTDLNVRDIEDSWFRFFSVATPMRLFCVPHHIPNSTYFEEVNRKAGLSLDRARIVMLAEHDSNRSAVLAGAPAPMGDLVKIVVDGFEVVQPVRGQRQRRGAGARRSRLPERAARPNQP